MGNITRTLANNLTSSLGAGGGSGMHTLLNTYNASGISTDLEMDFPVNGGTYSKFRILIENLYSLGVSKIAFKLKNNSASTYDQLNAGAYQAAGRKYQAGAGSSEIHAITSFYSEEANRHNHFDFICAYPGGAFNAYGKHLMWLGDDTTNSQTYSTYQDFSYQNQIQSVSGIDKIVLKPDNNAWQAGTIKIYGIS